MDKATVKQLEDLRGHLAMSCTDADCKAFDALVQREKELTAALSELATQADEDTPRDLRTEHFDSALETARTLTAKEVSHSL